MNFTDKLHKRLHGSELTRYTD